MISQVILHIGLHHTGTTSFQVFLNKHRDELQRQGVSVYRPLNNRINAAELRPAAQLTHGVSHFEDVKRAIQVQCSTIDADKLIVSAESLWSMNAESDLRRLKSLFPAYLTSFKIIMVLRDAEDWARRHWDILDHEEVDAEGVRATWAHSIDGYKSVFGDICLLMYERSGMVEMLCESCGINVAGLKVDYAYHSTSKLKVFIKRYFPGFLRFYSRHLAHSMVGKAKRKLYNE